MTVESNKTSSNYCNLSWKSLKNGSSDEPFLIPYCSSKKNGSRKDPFWIRYCQSNKAVEIFPSVSLIWEGFAQKRQ